MPSKPEDIDVIISMGYEIKEPSNFTVDFVE